jgi:hypothetical protein
MDTNRRNQNVDVFCDVLPCNPIEIYHRFGNGRLLSPFEPVDGGSKRSETSVLSTRLHDVVSKQAVIFTPGPHRQLLCFVQR